MKKTYVIGLVILAVAVGAAVVLAWPRPAAAPRPTPTGSSSPQPAQSYTGKIKCLPHKNTNGPQTLECAFGIEAADGKNYGVKMSDNSLSLQQPIGTIVTVKGSFKAPASNEAYDVVGNIIATSIEPAQ